jgi:hypothetical protein
MSNQTSSTVTPSLNSPPPAPPASPATTFGSIGDSLSNIGSNIGETVSDVASRASEAASNLTNQASTTLDNVSDTVSSSLTGTEPESTDMQSSQNTTEAVTQPEEVNQPSEETLANQSTEETLANMPSMTKRKRCRNGTRKDKDGNCQSKQTKQTKHRKSAVKSHHMTAKYHELKLENNILIKQQKKAINLTKKLMNFLTLQ